jgi:hypothetical protein
MMLLSGTTGAVAVASARQARRLPTTTRRTCCASKYTLDERGPSGRIARPVVGEQHREPTLQCAVVATER